MNCTYLGQKAESLLFLFPNHTPPPIGGLLRFLIHLASVSPWLNSPAKRKAKWSRKTGLLNVCVSQFRIQLFTTKSWLPGRQWSLGINLPQELQPSSFPEQHFSTRATLATRRCSTTPGMARLSQPACGRCWWQQMGGNHDASRYPTTHRTPLLCRTVIAVG